VSVVNGTCESPRTPVVATVLQAPQANAGPDHSILEGESVQLQGSGFGTFKWTPSTGLNNPNIANPTVIKPEETITYTLTVTNANGCVESDSVTVTVRILLTIPDAFTPNNDGVNDTWEIGNISKHPEVSVEIFDRWGGKVFSSRGYEKPWDGTLNGTALPVATYYYIIDPGNGEKPKAGSLTIIR
jgi:large repetitive protein